MTSTAEQSSVPQETLEAIVELVGTGPVLLGGYTLAEIDAVGAIRHLQEANPDGALVTEAARSLAARNLISTDRGSDAVQIRGDLGIAISFQYRSRVTIDARVTGTEPDEPWRFILMPQPEGITLEVLIDALGIHLYSLRTAEEALERLWERLPSGDRGPQDADAKATLEASPRTALISVNRWDEQGDLDTVDLALAEQDGTCHSFVRDEQDPSRLVPAAMDEDEWRDLVTERARP
ncbi:hypothetical protein [Janibacter corallicola]|uniref:hypothetical protein n=1 Tax=Janibacter corallicola TaxID=415212 RepID=UPI000834469E|nr:hypothetical protein [Janibacter corallicola]